jgi:hypothetical protein
MLLEDLEYGDDPVCADTSNLMYEFIQEVKSDPKLRNRRTSDVIEDLLTRGELCKPQPLHAMSAGYFSDMCHLGFDIGFQLCVSYQNGFADALAVLDRGRDHALCGDWNLINMPQVALIDQKLQADYKLRNQPAVAVMTRVALDIMPCH